VIGGLHGEPADPAYTEFPSMTNTWRSMYSLHFRPDKSCCSADNDAANGRRSRLRIPVIAGVALAATLALALPPTSAFAVTQTATIAISATVQATCLISATALAFGTYTGVVAIGTSTVTLTCTNSTPYTVGLSAGLGATPAATVTTRKMTGVAPATLNYALFSDTGRTANWGDTLATTWQAGTGNGLAQVLTVYGQVAAGQYVAPGSYTDTVTATITY
jgi:spore coat protein U-like protein